MQLKLAMLLIGTVSLLIPCVSAGIGLVGDEPVEIDVLSEYYRQSGEHAAVTGGIGTQGLTDIASRVTVRVPLNGRQLTVMSGLDFYTSASTDRIDDVSSSASSYDARGYLDISMSTTDPTRRVNFGATVGGSVEYDYRSFSAGGHLAWLSAGRTTEISLFGKVFLDQLDLIYPKELRATLYDTPPAGDYPTEDRTTYMATVTLTRVLSTRAQGAISVDIVHQNGYLSTPFHRVYFADLAGVAIERLPDSRLKYPVSGRFNMYLSELVVLRMHGRYYQDDWNVQSITLNAETPLRFTRAFTLIPFYRYHDQQAADYFYPYREASGTYDYYTSDWDLGPFSSHKAGLSFRVYPVEPLWDGKLPGLDDTLYLKRIDVRGSYYQRSDGLDAFSVNFGMGFYLQ